MIVISLNHYFAVTKLFDVLHTKFSKPDDVRVVNDPMFILEELWENSGQYVFWLYFNDMSTLLVD